MNRGLEVFWHQLQMRTLMFYAALVAGAIIALFPLAWVVSGSLKDDAEIIRSLSLIPQHINYQNYIVGWLGGGVSFGVYIGNSLILCLSAVAANVIACSLTGYAFARISFPGKRIMFAIMLATIFIPRHISIIPEYVIFQKLGLINTYIPIILPKLLGLDGFFVFLMTQFLRSLPVEIEEAAEIDGCNRFQTFFYIVIPIMRPAIVTVGILTFIFTYQDFMSQLIFINSADKFTVSLGLQSFVDQTSSSALGPTFAMSVLSIAPVVLLFIFFQRRIIDGAATSGLK